MQVYKVPRFYIAYNIALPGIISCGGLAVGIISLSRGQTSISQIVGGFFLAGSLVVCVWGWYVVLCKRPVEVGLAEDGSLVFRSMIGSIKIAIQDIISIKDDDWFKGPPFIVFQHSCGTITLLGPLKGFEELLDRILALNPIVDLSLFHGL